MLIEFTIPGAPFGKQRPRHTKNGHTYTPEQTKNYEQLVAWTYRTSAKGYRYPGKTALELCVYAYYPIPKSATKRERAAMISGELRPTVKPDYDNVAKIVTDALNGIAYDDDKCVVDAVQRKYYGETPRIEVTIREAVKGDTKWSG